MTTDQISLLLTVEQGRAFAEAWKGELRADLESSPNPWWDRGEVQPSIEHVRDIVAEYAELLHDRIRVLDDLQWGECRETAEVSISRTLVERVLAAMLDSGSMGPTTREEVAVAQVAFAIEDQMANANAEVAA